MRVSIPGENGERKQKYFYGTTQREAREKARAFQLELENGLDFNDIDTTVETWLAKWVKLTTDGKSHGNRITKYSIASRIVEKIGDMRMRDVKEFHLQETLNSLQGYSKSYITKARTIIRASFAAAERNGLIPKNPANYLEAPKGTYTGHRALEPWEIDLIVNNWRIRRGGFWVMLMLFSGMRRGEACALQIADYDREAKKIHIVETMHAEYNKMVSSGTTKTEAGIRTVPILGPLPEMLEEYIDSGSHTRFVEKEPNEVVSVGILTDGIGSFIDAIEKIHNGISPEKRVRKKAKEEGWKRVHFTSHDLRYTFATMLYDAGVDEKTAQLWMGHTSAAMTRDLYAKLTREREQLSTDALESYMERFKKE